MAPKPPPGRDFDWIVAKPVEVEVVVSEGIRRLPAVTSTAFWAHLWREFPGHSRRLREIVAMRRASGLIKDGAEFRWIVGCGGAYVEQEPGGDGRIAGLAYTLDPRLPLGEFLLVRVERVCP